MPIICEPDEGTARRLAAGFREHGRVAPDLQALGHALKAHPQELVVVLGPGVDPRAALTFTSALRLDRPSVGVVLVRTGLDVDTLAEAMRAGVRDVVPDRDFPALMDACRRCWEVSSRLRAAGDGQGPARQGAPAGRNGRVVVVFAGKGGCGKSMVSTNLAAILAQRGGEGAGKVCILDLDLGFGDVGIMLRVRPQRTIVDAVPMVEHMDETGVQSMLVRHGSGLSAVLAPLTPGEAEQVSGKLVTELLGVLKRMFDAVIVDTPSQFSEHVLAALDAADMQLLLASPEVTALKGLRVTLDMLDLLGYSAGSRAVVLNRADAKAGLSQSDIDRVVSRPISAHIPSSPDVPASINRGVPISLHDPQHPVSRALQAIATLAVEGPEAFAARPAAQRRGGLRRSRAGRS